MRDAQTKTLTPLDTQTDAETGGGTLQTRADERMKRLGTQTITNMAREMARCKDWGHRQSQTRTGRQTDKETGDTDNHKHGQRGRQMKRLGTQTITNTDRDRQMKRHRQSQTRTETDAKTGETDNHKHWQRDRQMQRLGPRTITNTDREKDR